MAGFMPENTQHMINMCFRTIWVIARKVHTVCVGAAIGHACLLLSAGSKGNRSMMPHSIAMMQQPRVPSSGLMPASDVLIRAKEPEETIRTAMRRPFYMDGTRAKEFGVIDMILWHGQESIIADVGAPEEWDKKAGIKSVDGF
ncbi:hypothetical protein Q3G72_010931 [Acer saccharum]|nr:hypothetical protein Q3G72_010931 [Acer saccharum]